MPDVASDTETEALLDRIPVVAGLPRSVVELSGGLTNQNLHVTTAGPSGGDYVVRRFRGDADLLGIDRDAEHFNTVAAAEAGVGAPVVCYLPELSVLVIEYIDGVTYDNDTFDRPGVIPRVARAIRTLHDGPRFRGEFDMFTRQERYLRTVAQQGYPLFEGYHRHQDAFARVRSALAVRQDPTVPCNNDLLAGNFMDDGDKLRLIDYEYSGNNDPCFELGNTSTECDLTEEQVEELVEAYFGAPLRNKLARVRLQALVSAYGWSLWGAIQASASTLDFDFTAWGQERLDKAARGFTADSFPALLDEVQRDD